MEQSMVRKHWPMTKVNSMFMEVARDMPAVRISAGWISAGTNQPRGPAGTWGQQRWSV